MVLSSQSFFVIMWLGLHGSLAVEGTRVGRFLSYEKDEINNWHKYKYLQEVHYPVPVSAGGYKYGSGGGIRNRFGSVDGGAIDGDRGRDSGSGSGIGKGVGGGGYGSGEGSGSGVRIGVDIVGSGGEGFGEGGDGGPGGYDQAGGRSPGFGFGSGNGYRKGHGPGS